MNGEKESSFSSYRFESDSLLVDFHDAFESSFGWGRDLTRYVEDVHVCGDGEFFITDRRH